MPRLYQMGIYYSFYYKTGLFHKTEHHHSGFASLDRFYFEAKEEDAKARFVTYLVDDYNRQVVEDLIVDKVVWKNNTKFIFTEFVVMPQAIYSSELTIEELKNKMPARDFIRYCEFIRTLP